MDTCTLPPQFLLLVYPNPLSSEQRGAEPTQCGKGRQFTQFDQSQMCVSVRDPGRETWDIVLLQGLARAAHRFSVCVCVCVCVRMWDGHVFWDMLHGAERKCAGTCVCSIWGVRKQRDVSHCFTLKSSRTSKENLYQYIDLLAHQYTVTASNNSS